jgi:hypothetical protein
MIRVRSVPHFTHGSNARQSPALIADGRHRCGRHIHMPRTDASLGRDTHDSRSITAAFPAAWWQSHEDEDLVKSRSAAVRENTAVRARCTFRRDRFRNIQQTEWCRVLTAGAANKISGNDSAAPRTSFDSPSARKTRSNGMTGRRPIPFGIRTRAPAD